VTADPILTKKGRVKGGRKGWMGGSVPKRRKFNPKEGTPRGALQRNERPGGEKPCDRSKVGAVPRTDGQGVPMQ